MRPYRSFQEFKNALLAPLPLKDSLALTVRQGSMHAKLQMSDTEASWVLLANFFFQGSTIQIHSYTYITYLQQQISALSRSLQQPLQKGHGLPFLLERHEDLKVPTHHLCFWTAVGQQVGCLPQLHPAEELLILAERI